MRSNEPFRTIGTLRLHVMEGTRVHVSGHAPCGAARGG